MSDQLEDFHTRLYSIRPFLETQSPPSSPHKTNSNSSDVIFPSGEEIQTVYEGYNPFKELTPLRRVVSECKDLPPVEGTGQSNFRTISSISSTIDMLFSKIEKIKQQFSYALDKPHSLQDIKPPYQHPLFQSQKNIDFTANNKQNILLAEGHQAVEKSTEGSPCRFPIHSLSLPLQDHNQNLGYRQYSSYSVDNNNSYEPLNLFQTFQYSSQLPLAIHQNSPSLQPRINGLKISDFQLGRCIGSGKFGDVYVSMHRATGFLCAIKKIFKSTIREYGMQDQLTCELRIHYGLNHPNIVQLYGHFDDEYHIFLLMEYACEGTMMQRLHCEQQKASQAVEQVLQAVNYLHRKRVVHRDIKPENIVCSLGVAKLCDFGWATVIQNNMKRTFCGTLDYVSPEMKDVGEYNESVDLWSVGVLAFELLAGFPPYRQQISNWKLCGSQRKVRWNWEVIFPPEISYSAQLFIQGLLKENPAERASITESLCSIFIMSHCRQEQELQCFNLD